MAQLKPLRGWRYNPKLFSNLNNVCSPLFDVITPAQRKQLYQISPYNSIHISVPQGETPFEEAQERIKQWKKEHVLVQDVLPTIYVYYQYFSVQGKLHIRKGFIANIKLQDWEDKVVLPHENTLSESVKERTTLLDYTQMNVSPTHGLYSDPKHELEVLMDKYMQHPIYKYIDYQGVEDRMAMIQDAKDIAKIMAHLHPKTIYLADGHHRYESSLRYYQTCKKNNVNHTGEEGYNYHLMYFTALEPDGIRILATHRVVNIDLPKTHIVEQLSAHFKLEKVENPLTLPFLIQAQKHTFGLVFNQEYYLATLISSLDEMIPYPLPESVKQLDYTLLHYGVFEKMFGVDIEHQRTWSGLSFSRDVKVVLQKVEQEGARVGFILNTVSKQNMIDVCNSGAIMPMKSTYFYPKVLCGFVFGAIDELHENGLDKSFA